MQDDLSELPQFKRDFIVREFGEPARAWIENFPALVAECVGRWRLDLKGVAAAGLPINVIYYAEQDGVPVLLKVGHPHPEQVTEMIALRAYGGRSAPRLIDCSEKLGATLMERIVPGTTFRESARSPARSRMPLPLFDALPRPMDHVDGLPYFEEWLTRAFAEFREKFEPGHTFHQHVDKAEQVYAELRDRNPANFLLHGDLHHENILADERRGWVAIDPKGVIGPKSMEVGRFLHNFIEDEIEGVERPCDASLDQLCEILRLRYDCFAATFGTDRMDIARAAFVDAVLSFCWTINSDHPYQEGIVRVDAVRSMLGE